jgi:hypothetical protein
MPRLANTVQPSCQSLGSWKLWIGGASKHPSGASCAPDGIPFYGAAMDIKVMQIEHTERGERVPIALKGREYWLTISETRELADKLYAVLGIGTAEQSGDAAIGDMVRRMPEGWALCHDPLLCWVLYKPGGIAGGMGYKDLDDLVEHSFQRKSAN